MAAPRTAGGVRPVLVSQSGWGAAPAVSEVSHDRLLLSVAPRQYYSFRSRHDSITPLAVSGKCTPFGYRRLLVRCRAMPGSSCVAPVALLPFQRSVGVNPDSCR